MSEADVAEQYASMRKALCVALAIEDDGRHWTTLTEQVFELRMRYEACHGREMDRQAEPR